MNNPLLSNWTTEFSIAPFKDIKDSHFKEAFEFAVSEQEKEIETVSKNPAKPTFENTIKEVFRAGKLLDQVLTVFYTLASADTNKVRESLQREFAPKLAKLHSSFYHNTDLFEKINYLYQKIDQLGLDKDEVRVLQLTHRNFIRSGAQLSNNNRIRHKEITKKLSELGTSFSQNLLADERDWHLELGESDIHELPHFLQSATKSAALEKGINGQIINLSRSLVVPFLKYSPNRALRQKVYEAFTSRGAMRPDTNNIKNVKEMLKLRDQLAKILSYESFSAFRLETEMAKTPKNVRDLLMKVWEPTVKAVNRDAKALQGLMDQDNINDKLKAWDWYYYSEKRRLLEYDLDETILKPYFLLENILEAAFECSKRLFNLEFSKKAINFYHPDCLVYEVTRDGSHKALLVCDYFARSTKRSGAWCSAMRSQSKMDKPVYPVVLNICNFTKPEFGNPTLLSYDDAKTLFHEFGHALHQILSDVTFEMISGTSVPRDFVELPSQLFEHWLEIPEIMTKYVRHFETNKSLSPALLNKVIESRNYDVGFATMEYLASAIVDLEFHSNNQLSDPIVEQSRILKKIGIHPAVNMRHSTTNFSHIFSGGGYASAYYSYMWSEVMDTDAFEAFTETNNLFDSAIAKKLEKYIFSSGGSEEPDFLYMNFRGRMPNVSSLLKGRGLDF